MVRKFKFRKTDIGKFKTKNTTLIVKDLEHGYRQIGLTMGNFSLIDLIYAILKKIGSSDLIICTWSEGIKDVHNVRWMLDTSLIKKVTLLLDHSYKTRQHQYAASIEELFGIENIRTSEVHAKFVLIENENWNITIITSMNLNANKTCEMFEIETSKEVYCLFREYADFVFENQKEGFVSDSSTVMRTLDMFFKSNLENRLKGWSEL